MDSIFRQIRRTLIAFPVILVGLWTGNAPACESMPATADCSPRGVCSCCMMAPAPDEASLAITTDVSKVVPERSCVCRSEPSNATEPKPAEVPSEHRDSDGREPDASATVIPPILSQPAEFPNSVRIPARGFPLYLRHSRLLI